MKNYHTARSGILALLLLAFSFVQAQVVITPVVTGTCHGGDGSVTFNLTNGNSGTHYFNLYSGNGSGNIGQQTTPTFTGLAEGYYYLRLGGADSGYVTVQITPRVNISLGVTNTTCPLNQGAINASVTGGTPNYQFLWSNGATTSSISNLAGARYSLTVTDANTCTASLDTQVFSTTSMTVAISNSGTVCTPTLTALATGGTGSVTYHWSNGSNGAAITGLGAYSYYIVTATDANSCTAASGYSTGSNTIQIDSMNGGSVNIIYPGCNGANTGSITIHVRNGTSPFTFHWSGSASTDSVASGLVVGQYAVTVTDANGCTGSNSYYLGNYNQVQTYICNFTDPSCGASDGYIEACAYNGTPPYSFVWSNTSTAPTQTGLAAGTYTVTATDANGCSALTSRALVGRGNYQVAVTVTPTACDTSLHTGTATAVILGAGGTPPYSFAWYNNQTYPNTLIGTGQTVTGLAYQSYLNVVVTDASGCGPISNYDSAGIQLDPSCYDHVTGYVYGDANSNCTKDPGESGLGGAYIIVSGGNGTYWGTPDSTGYYDIEVVPGTYTVSASLNNLGSCIISACHASYTPSFTAIGQISTGNDFGIDAGAQTFDLGVHPGCTPSTPGATKDYWVYYYNRGVTAAPNTVVSFTHDPNITLVSTNPTYTSYNATTHLITWNLGSLLPNQYNGWIGVHATFDVPPTLTLGTYLTSVAEIDPISGDCNPADNIVSMSDMVSGSHDPNEKEVYPAGNLTESDSVLNYTVRFQNNGNAPASIVVIKDTLSAYVDPASVIPGASSHPYKFAMSGRGILTFTFENINLPDSTHGDSSKGYVTYSVHTKRNLPLGTQIKNTAFIYFDINSAVVTNTTNSTRSDYQTGIRNVAGNDGLTVTVSPNPVQERSVVHISGATGEIGFDLMDIRGQKVMETTTTKTDITLESEMFAPGVYVYTVRDASGKSRSGKVLIAH